ncbi:hypothetical protein VZC37_11785 [Gordonia sp. LSe1-13]|uniref:Mce-associated membrane protein n=1 Tax=Gordonia sesuvii TaxID=3116777 RepID=A0ABU7MDA6_9ACTN|nr:hypothetical protein [Gordonia sp. LSe1-13]
MAEDKTPSAPDENENTGTDDSTDLDGSTDPDTHVTESRATDRESTDGDTPKREDKDEPAGNRSGPVADDKPAAEDKPAVVSRSNRASRSSRQLSISVGTLAISVLVIALVAALVTFAYRDFSARDELNALTSEAADSAAAEEVAGRYAVSAATLDYEDLTPWIAAMKDGVSPELQKKYDVIGQAMEQIITPLRMQTTAELVLAKTTESNGDMFQVDAVVNVNTTSVQTPDGGSAVAVYTVTLDRSQDWLITEVGDPTGAIPGSLEGAAPEAAPQESAPQESAPPPPPAPAPAPGG